MNHNTDAASGEKTIEERAILEQVLTIFAERESLIVETAELRAEVERLRAENERLKRPSWNSSLDEALNSGDGTYKP